MSNISKLTCFYLLENRIKVISNIDSCIFCKTDPTSQILFEQNTITSDVSTNVII